MCTAMRRWLIGTVLLLSVTAMSQVLTYPDDSLGEAEITLPAYTGIVIDASSPPYVAATLTAATSLPDTTWFPLDRVTWIILHGDGNPVTKWLRTADRDSTGIVVTDLGGSDTLVLIGVQ